MSGGVQPPRGVSVKKSFTCVNGQGVPPNLPQERSWAVPHPDPRERAAKRPLDPSKGLTRPLSRRSKGALASRPELWTKYRASWPPSRNLGESDLSGARGRRAPVAVTYVTGEGRFVGGHVPPHDTTTRHRLSRRRPIAFGRRQRPGMGAALSARRDHQSCRRSGSLEDERRRCGNRSLASVR